MTLCSGDDLPLALLQAPGPRVRPVGGEQLVVRAALGHAAVLEEHDQVGIGDGGQPVRDDQGRAVGGDLDRKTADEILGLLQVLNREHGKTIVMVTHDPKAADHAQRVVHLDKGTMLDTEIPGAS